MKASHFDFVDVVVGSAAALDHQIGLAIDITDRLTMRVQSAPQTG